MIDFSKLQRQKAGEPPLTLKETFERLDRLQSHVELRPSQLSILDEMDRRIDDRDLVLKMGTGNGKTIVGLLYLQRHMQKSRSIVVYLVPTLQLIDQVIADGKSVGINVEAWTDRVAPDRAIRGEAVLVCTYAKFFNGRSVFARSTMPIVPEAMVLDDVHAGIEAVRGNFSAKLSAETRIDLLELMGQELRAQVPGLMAGVEKKDDAALIEVPYWIIKNHLPRITELLAAAAEEEDSDLLFAWPHLVDRLELARFFVTGTRAEVALDPPAVDLVRHYQQCKHRLFMSASIQDGSALIRELGCAPTAANAPLEPTTDAGVGERLILTTSLVDPDLHRDTVVSLCKEMSRETNVVVFVASEVAARPWVAAGATHPSTKEISETIHRLRSSHLGNFVVMVQRYDGIDLPDNACRLLVVDGIPIGDSLSDRVDLQLFGSVVGIRGKIANRLEQGLGRGVRSSSDYCAVLLVGRDLGNFVSHRATIDHLSPQVAKQLEISREISGSAREGSTDSAQAIGAAIRQCLRRDSGWKAYYAGEMRAVSSTAEQVTTQSTMVKVATLEREGLRKATSRNFREASKALEIAASELVDQPLSAGALLEHAARYMHHADHVAAQSLQRRAFEANQNVARPLQMHLRDVIKTTSQAMNLAAWLKDFSDPNGPAIEIRSLRAALSFANPVRRVEEALRDLGRLLGANSTMPEREFGRGPDVLWHFGEVTLVIEAKTDNRTKLHKTDAAQLLLGHTFVEEQLPRGQKFVAVIASNTEEVDRFEDWTFGAKLLSETVIGRILDSFDQMVMTLVKEGALFASEASIVQTRLTTHALLPNQLVERMPKAG